MTHSIVHFGALEQALRLHVFAGPVDKYFVFVIRSALTVLQQ
jgi:hypothetical protein